jgi:hypothetical protein
MYKNNLDDPEVIRNLNSKIQRFHIINYCLNIQSCTKLSHTKHSPL